MSENLDLARSICTAWARGDYSSVVWADPEINWVFADGPSPGVWTGLTGLAEGSREFLGAWDDLHVHADELQLQLSDAGVSVERLQRSAASHLSGVLRHFFSPRPWTQGRGVGVRGAFSD